jgi:histidinol-phosphate aminotransferase
MTDASAPLKFRAALDGLPAYVPGKPPTRADGGPTYKLSSNENPYPPLPGVLAAATEAAASMNRYPDLASTALLDALAGRFGVAPERIAVGTGSVGVLYHLLQAACEPGDEVVYAWRSFEAYPIAAQVCGATRVEVPLAPGARHDLDAMADAITEHTRAVIVCTPNNPTGPVVGHAKLAAFVRRVPEDVLVVVDEAYVQFIRDRDAADGIALYREHPNVCVLRTFSKAYSLANLRVGFAIAHEPVAAAIRACTPPFAVSTVAEDAALAALASEETLFERVELLVKERSRVFDALRDQGWDVPSTESNFVWMPLGERADEFAIACEAEGIVVRAFAGDGCRVTVAEPEANDVFLEVAARWRSGSS